MRLGTDLVQHVNHIPERSLDAISAFIPVPISEEIVIDGFVVYKDVLAKLRGIIVKEVAEGIDGLGHGSGEECIYLREFLRQGDEGL